MTNGAAYMVHGAIGLTSSKSGATSQHMTCGPGDCLSLAHTVNNVKQASMLQSRTYSSLHNR